jgi:hypothetical protein
MVPAGSGKVRGVLTKFGSDYQLLAVPKRCGDDCAKQSLFSQDFQAVVDKTNLSLPGWTNIVQSGKTFWKGTVYSGNGYAEFNTTEPKCYPMSLGFAQN